MQIPESMKISVPIYMSSITHFQLGDVSIIAMKGYPFTRKTEFAESIAKSLNCPILSLDGALINLEPPVSPKKELEAFKAICEIAIQQLDIGITKNVVIDSPLSSHSHFIHLTRRIEEALGHYCYSRGSIRVIVIECTPTHNYTWKLRFRRRSYKWFKPKNWEELDKYIEEHPDYDVTSVSLSYTNVSKLVVDPLLDFPYKSSSPSSSPGNSRLVEAVKYMMTRDRGDGPDVVVYREWLQQRLSSSTTITPLGEEHCRAHGHDILPNYTAMVAVEGLIQQQMTVDCMFCERRVTRGNDNNMGSVSYCYCKNCSFTLHMDCALSTETDFEWSSRKPPTIYRWCTHGDNCQACRLDDLLQYPCKYPAAIEHVDTKEHFLTILFLDGEEDVYRCVACGENKLLEKMYLCKDCGFAYHYECVTLPRRVKNVHGAHHHHLSLKFESEEAEDYICHECREYRDPTLWYYSCEDCPYELHRSCVASLSKMMSFGGYSGWIEEEEIKEAERVIFHSSEMEESESISDYYSRVIYLIQWYGSSRYEEGELVQDILDSLPSKFYHIVVSIKRSKGYESMSVDQLMICLHLFEKRIDNGENMRIEQVLANLYATQRSRYQRGSKHYRRKSKKLIMNVADVSFKTVLCADYSKGESGENWVKYWGRYWDKYWFNYEKGYYSNQDKCKVQCSICYMFGHHPQHCWKVSNKVKKKPHTIKNKFKLLIQTHSNTENFQSKE